MPIRKAGNRLIHLQTQVDKLEKHLDKFIETNKKIQKLGFPERLRRASALHENFSRQLNEASKSLISSYAEMEKARTPAEKEIVKEEIEAKQTILKKYTTLFNKSINIMEKILGSRSRPPSREE
jgi:hypothetical protein